MIGDWDETLGTVMGTGERPPGCAGVPAKRPWGLCWELERRPQGSDGGLGETLGAVPGIGRDPRGCAGNWGETLGVLPRIGVRPSELCEGPHKETP